MARHAPRSWLELSAALCCLLLVGCVSTRDDNRGRELDASLKTFTKLMRWGEFESASAYLVSRDGAPRAVNLDRLRGFRITQFEVSSQIVANDGAEVKVQHRVQYYGEDSGVVRTLQYDQNWWYDPERRRWFVDSDLPELK